jgi:hypothetical protein
MKSVDRGYAAENRPQGILQRVPVLMDHAITALRRRAHPWRTQGCLASGSAGMDIESLVRQRRIQMSSKGQMVFPELVPIWKWTARQDV